MGIAEFIIGRAFARPVGSTYPMRYALTKDVTAQDDRIINARFAVYRGISLAIALCPSSARSGRSINIMRTCTAWAFDPSLQLRGNGRRKTAGRCPGDRYFRHKTQARRPEAAGLRLALSVRWSGDRPGFGH